MEVYVMDKVKIFLSICYFFAFNQGCSDNNFAGQEQNNAKKLEDEAPQVVDINSNESAEMRSANSIDEESQIQPPTPISGMFLVCDYKDSTSLCRLENNDNQKVDLKLEDIGKWAVYEITDKGQVKYDLKSTDIKFLGSDEPWHVQIKLPPSILLSKLLFVYDQRFKWTQDPVILIPNKNDTNTFVSDAYEDITFSLVDVYEFYDSNTNDHYYSTQNTNGGLKSFRVIEESGIPGTKPLYVCYGIVDNKSNHFLSPEFNCESDGINSYENKELLGYIFQTIDYAIPLARCLSNSVFDHIVVSSTCPGNKGFDIDGYLGSFPEIGMNKIRVKK